MLIIRILMACVCSVCCLVRFGFTEVVLKVMTWAKYSARDVYQYSICA